MAFIVECLRTNASCNISTFAWDKLLELARQHGWHPAGCTFDLGTGPAQPHWGQPTDYHWDDWQYAKRVNAEDAKSLAIALRRAIAAGETQSGPHLISDSGFVDRGLLGSALALADFCERGGFTFAVDD